MKSNLTVAEVRVNKATALLAPPKPISVSAWADAHRILSPESGASPGPWRTLAFQREIFDSFSHPDIERVAVMAATQVVKTETLLNALGWIIDVDPGPVLAVFPRDSDVEKFSKVRLSPMVRDSASLRMKVKDQADRHSGDTIFHKSFPGGHVVIAAAGSPGNLSALPIRYLLLDEIDKFAHTSGAEGDPLALAEKRTSTFHNRKLLMCSSPTVSGESRIEKAYLESDQRRFEIPCHACGAFQVLQWSRVRWSKEGTNAERAATAVYLCVACDAPWTDIQRWTACERGRWTAQAAFNGTAGFWISELYSPWKKLSALALDFMTMRKDPHRFKTFVNTSLAETWQQQGERPLWASLYSRREFYPLGTAPARVHFLTAACDVQADRLEVLICGWGPGRECWPIDYIVLAGDTTNTGASGPWQRAETGLHAVLTRAIPTASGGQLYIMCMTVDTGFRPQPAYEFARQHGRPTYSAAGSRCPSVCSVAVTKGNDRADQLITSVSSIDVARQARAGIQIAHVGSHYAKQMIYDLLRLEAIRGHDESASFPSGFIHLPDFSRDFFRGLVSETRIVRDSGRVDWVEDPNTRNEPLDLIALSFAAAEICGITRFTTKDWESLRVSVAPGTSAPPSSPLATPSAPAVPATAPQPVRRPIRGHFKM